MTSSAIRRDRLEQLLQGALSTLESRHDGDSEYRRGLHDAYLSVLRRIARDDMEAVVDLTVTHGRVRADAPDTSADTGHLLTEDSIREHHDLLLRQFVEQGWTDIEMEARLAAQGTPLKGSTVRPRRGELEGGGFVYRTDEKRPTQPGNPNSPMAAVYALTDRGRRLAEQRGHVLTWS